MRILFFLFLLMLFAHAFGANGLLGVPDDTSYTVNCMHTNAPDHIWLLQQEGASGTTIQDECGSSDLTLSSASVWAADVGGTGVDGFDFEATAGDATGGTLGITDFPFTLACLVKFDQQHNGMLFNMGDLSDPAYYGVRTHSSNGRLSQYRRNDQTAESDTDNFNSTNYTDDTWRWIWTAMQGDSAAQAGLDASLESGDTDTVDFDANVDAFVVGQQANGSISFSGQVAACMVFERDIESGSEYSTIFGTIGSTGFPFITYAPTGPAAGVLRKRRE